MAESNEEMAKNLERMAAHAETIYNWERDSLLAGAAALRAAPTVKTEPSLEEMIEHQRKVTIYDGKAIPNLSYADLHRMSTHIFWLLEKLKGYLDDPIWIASERKKAFDILGLPSEQRA